MEALQRISDATLANMTGEQLLAELLERVSEILSSDTAAILLLDERRGVLQARAAKGIEEEVDQGVEIPLGRGFAGKIASSREAIAIDDVDHSDVLNPILRQKGIKSLLGVPLLVEGRVLGVMHVGSLVPRIFTEEEGNLLQLAADRAAVAIENASLEEQRQVAEALQRRILATYIDAHAITPRLEIASRYLPATGQSLGGDWYDAFRVRGGRVAMAVGDVVGHGIQAAAVMTQLRTALRAYAAEGHDPGGVVDRVNRLMLDLGPSTMTTLAFVVFDPDGQEVTLVNAGHPPPLLVGRHDARYLDVPVSLPLGIDETATYSTTTEHFAAGSTLVLYTDGLVERRGASLDEGLETLRLTAEGETEVEALCTKVVSTMIPGDRADDVALVAAQVPTIPETLVGRWPAEASQLAPVRQLLRGWLKWNGATETETYEIVLASQEACANAIEHAYGPGEGDFELTADRAGRRVEIRVTDNGSWRAPRGTDRGRGLPLMHAMVDDVTVTRDNEGTTVVLTRDLEL